MTLANNTYAHVPSPELMAPRSPIFGDKTLEDFKIF